MRILVTGSRDWDKPEFIEKILGGYRELIPAPMLVVGACPSGADRYAEEIWSDQWQLPIERHPADWESWGKSAGPRRNQQMVNLGADLCLAFLKDGSRGTTDCGNKAILAGIPTIWYPYEFTEEYE